MIRSDINFGKGRRATALYYRVFDIRKV